MTMKKTESKKMVIPMLTEVKHIKSAGETKPQETQEPAKAEVKENEPKAIAKSEEAKEVKKSDEVKIKESKTSAKPKEKQKMSASAGSIIRECFSNLVSNGKITEEILKILTDAEATKKTLGIRYAFLKEFDSKIGVKEQTYINGHARYTAKFFEINGKQYIITNDLYKKNVDKFTAWANELNK